MKTFTSREEYIILLVIALKLIKEKKHSPKEMIDAINEMRRIYYPDITETEMYDILNGLNKTAEKHHKILEKLQYYERT